MIPDSTFFGITGLSHDTLNIQFMTGAIEDYGNFFLTVTPPENPYNYTIQLLNSNDKIIKEHIIKEAQKLTFDYLKPGTYKVKAIEDRNMNGRWDTGRYTDKLQPERVIFFDKEIEVRANWDVEENWQIRLSDGSH